MPVKISQMTSHTVTQYDGEKESLSVMIIMLKLCDADMK